MGFEPVILGRTGLQTGRLALASSYGVPAEGIKTAFAAGVNYFYWGTWRRTGFGRGLRELLKNHRDEIVLVIQSYDRTGLYLERSLTGALKRLGTDHADVFLLGWYHNRPPDRILNTCTRLKEKGIFRFLGMSTHRRPLIIDLEKRPDNPFDLYHVRYNAAHRGAETDVFDHLPAHNRPGIVAFTATRWGTLVNPAYTPPAERTPTASDCYRFALSHPAVNVVNCAPNGMQQLEQGLTTLTAGPMSNHELAWMQRVGDHIYRSKKGIRYRLVQPGNAKH